MSSDYWKVNYKNIAAPLKRVIYEHKVNQLNHPLSFKTLGGMNHTVPNNPDGFQKMHLDSTRLRVSLAYFTTFNLNSENWILRLMHSLQQF